MRLSRPTLAHVPAHYFEATAPSSSSTASDTLSNALLARVDGSLLHYGLSQDPSAAAAAVDGGSAFHPATMRDFPLSALPTLPGSFGTISLGETFSAALCLSNDSAADVSHVRLRAEMQTASTKTLLSEVRGPDETGGGIDRGQALPLTVKWEIKELGLHILACEIFWFDDEAQGERSFRKVYKCVPEPCLPRALPTSALTADRTLPAARAGSRSSTRSRSRPRSTCRTRPRPPCRRPRATCCSSSSTSRTRRRCR